MISVHVEVLPHLHRTVHAIKALGVKAGVVINPATPVGALEQIAGDVDYVLVMSVNPGFGGQTFIPGSVAKIQAVRALLDRVKNPAPVEVDGGIDLQQRGPRRRRRRAHRRGGRGDLRTDERPGPGASHARAQSRRARCGQRPSPR